MAKKTYIPRNELIDMNAEINKVRVKAVEELMKYPGVLAVGVGMVVTKGELQRELCLKVTVVKKESLSSLKKKNRIPKTIFGFRTDVIQVPNVVALEDEKQYRPLIGGIQIMNSLKPNSFGTLGCFAKRNIDNKIVALSNWHVMISDPNAINNEKIGQSYYTDCCTCCSCGEIGEVIAGQLDSNMDAAIALLNGQDGDLIPDVRYLNEIHSIGIVTGSDPVYLPGETVFKRGRTTELTIGQLTNDTATFSLTYDTRVVNFVGQLTIFPTIPDNYHMSLRGDSGSVLVNELNKVIGLNFASDKPSAKIPGPTEILKGYSSPIAPVLAALDITILDSSFPSTANKSGVPLSGSAIHRNTAPSKLSFLETLQEQLNASKTGKNLSNVFEKHRKEIFTLVRKNKEVMVAWHRYEGPSFLSHMSIGAKRNKDIPNEINGISLQNLMLKMTAVLQRNGSAELQKSIADNYLTVFEVFSNGSNIEDWKDNLKKVDNKLTDKTQVHA